MKRGYGQQTNAMLPNVAVSPNRRPGIIHSPTAQHLNFSSCFITLPSSGLHLIPGLTRGASKLRAAASELKRLGASTARAEGAAGTVLDELRALPSKQALGLRAEVAGRDFHSLPFHLFIFSSQLTYGSS